MQHTNLWYTERILDCLDEIELDNGLHPHVNANGCREYIKRLCNGKPLSHLDHNTLRLAYNMLDTILYR